MEVTKRLRHGKSAAQPRHPQDIFGPADHKVAVLGYPQKGGRALSARYGIAEPIALRASLR